MRINYEESVAGMGITLKKGDKVLTAANDIETVVLVNTIGNVLTKENGNSWAPDNLKKVHPDRPKLQSRYRELEVRVMRLLREKVEASEIRSKDYDSPSILATGIENYAELIIVNDRLTFINDKGYQYSVFNADLQSLINLL